MEFFKKIKKEFGETAAKELKNIPFDNVDVFIKTIKELIPIKETRSEVIKKIINILTEKLSSKEEEEKETEENIKDILDRANYEMIVPSCLDEAKKDFQKYYKNDEVICSLRNGSDRFDNSHVAFFVKKNINEINRGELPEKKDEYSTSLLCVQISKNSKMLKCISRYNHSVNNCDFVYTNLDEISWGLHTAFYKFFNENPYKNEKIQLPDGLIEFKGQFFQYIKEFDGNYWGKGFVLTNKGEMKILDVNEQFLINGTIFDKNGFFLKFGRDSQMPNAEKIVKKSKNEFKFIFKNQKFIEVKINESLEITHLNGNIEELGNCFLSDNEEIEFISFPFLKKVGNDFLICAEKIKSIYFPLLEEVGNNFISGNQKIESICLPLLKKAGDSFLYCNKNLESISLPLLEKVGNDFLYLNEKINSISLPLLKEVGNGFLYHNKKIESISFPLLERIGNDFLHYNENLKYISLPLLKEAGHCFLYHNKKIESISLPLLKEVGDCFLLFNKNLKSISLPILKEAGHGFLHCNEKIESISFPLLKEVGDNFLHRNEKIQSISFPLLKEVGNGFLEYNKSLESVSLENLKEVGHDFLFDNQKIKSIYLPVLEKVGHYFLYHNKNKYKIINEINKKNNKNKKSY